MPYMDQAPLYNRWNANIPSGPAVRAGSPPLISTSTANDVLTQTRIVMLNCPSEPLIGPRRQLPLLNMCINGVRSRPTSLPRGTMAKTIAPTSRANEGYDTLLIRGFRCSLSWRKGGSGDFGDGRIHTLGVTRLQQKRASDAGIGGSLRRNSGSQSPVGPVVRQGAKSLSRRVSDRVEASRSRCGGKTDPGRGTAAWGSTPDSADARCLSAGRVRTGGRGS